MLIGSIAIILIGILAFLSPRYSKSKFLTFPLWIFFAMGLALLFPQHVVNPLGLFDSNNAIIPLLQLVMLFMGINMSARDFMGIVKTPKGVIIGLLCQFTIMPLTGYFLTKVFSLPTEIAAGVILIGCSPSGLSSNVISYVAGANLALSITLTAFGTMLAPFITPLLMELLAGELVPIDIPSMMWSITKMIIFPVALGILLKTYFTKYVDKVAKYSSPISMGSIVIIIGIITAVGQKNLLDIGLLLAVVVLCHNMLGFTLGYGFAKLAGMDEKSCRTISIEVGLQNGGIASGIALKMGKVATMGVAPAMFGSLMNVTGSVLAGYWQKTKDKIGF